MEDCSSYSVLCHLTSLLLLIQLLTRGAAEFLVIGPSEPIVAVLGGDITLPCRVSPAMNVENMELRWFRSKFSEAVFIYKNGWKQEDELMAQYAGRTSLERELLTQGEAAVRIHKVQAADDGLYSCFFRKGDFYEEANLELKVVGVGSAPQVRITGPEEDGVQVVCTASGWFPKPQVQWRDLSGEKFLVFSEAHAQDAKGLFSVEAALVVKDRSVGNVTCSMLNPVLGQEKAMAIFIPEPFFPQSSPWKPAFLVSLTVLGLLLLAAGYYTQREHSAKLQELQEQKTLCQAKEQDRQAKEEMLKARDKLQAELDWRKTVYLAAWRKAQLYADWRQEKFQAWSVTLNPVSASPSLIVSPEKTRVTLKDTSEDSNSTCSVLGLEGITSGRCHWEVEVTGGDKSEWALGVCREDVEREGWYRESPDKGFWVVGKFGSEYHACTLSQTLLSLRQLPHRVGVFLDYDEGDVSFYNMTDGSHIFSFPPASFSGTLFPYFSLRSEFGSLTICPMTGASERLSVPLNNSLEEPMSLPGAGLSSGSTGDEVESPLLS
ncbi:butyrophilin subfamily 3 member A3-like isoform X1 [Phyllostomus hastatus]|uniref:butyrophilin subfamily 3 member A3-like isoform X1 n=2 Tax=Phyllostomus hastatus TaxID=9423 RepID=UPI001E681D45|nr:butyrophilin subfamily 3 member A3-like isoform X1 [Phyllostomus hastatus]XP_045682282.1 butyrophilin subfamily 3 member A3-like isoform X1 [Phyllostomus hastatus]XP_045682283.1 butyrophilin subfamily 3 member A3-like isoform X1 [Phyllostomus hastatus]